MSTNETEDELTEDFGITELFDAINADDAEEVKKLLQTHQYNLEERDDLGDTPLLKACIGGNIEIISSLINHGANVNVENTRHFEFGSPISTAIERMNDSLLRLLVSSGAKLPNALNETTNFETVKFLFKHNVKIDNECLLESITDGCDFATVKILIDVEVDVNYIDSFGDNALHLACKYNPNPEIIQTFINHGINKDVVNNDGKKPIDLLQNNSEEDLCRKIINQEIKIEIDESPTR